MLKLKTNGNLYTLRVVGTTRDAPRL